MELLTYHKLAVVIAFTETGAAPPLKQKKFKLRRDAIFQEVINFLRGDKGLNLAPSASLVRSFFHSKKFDIWHGMCSCCDFLLALPVPFH